MRRLIGAGRVAVAGKGIRPRAVGVTGSVQGGGAHRVSDAEGALDSDGATCTIVAEGATLRAVSAGRHTVGVAGISWRRRVF